MLSAIQSGDVLTLNEYMNLFPIDGTYDTDDNTIIHLAVIYDQPKVLSLFMSEILDLDAYNAYNWTPLMESLFLPDLQCFQILVNCGADINKGEPIVLALRNNKLRAAEILISANCDLSMLDYFNLDAFDWDLNDPRFRILESANVFLVRPCLEY